MKLCIEYWLTFWPTL